MSNATSYFVVFDVSWQLHEGEEDIYYADFKAQFSLLANMPSSLIRPLPSLLSNCRYQVSRCHFLYRALLEISSQHLILYI